MAYGLDVTDLIYTDSNLVDQGTLEDHEVDLDIAGEKNFELRSDSHIMEHGSLWYVDGTEFGGIVGKFETDPDNYQVIYTGRSFRGIQDSKIIEVPEGLNVVSYSGAITSVINRILEEYDLDSFFVCDVPDIDENLDVPPVVGKIDILSGTTVYEAITKIAESINFSFLYEFNAKDKKCHMIPVMVQDWIDLMAYNRDNTVKFKSSLNGDYTNHLICSGIDETGKRRTISLFLNENGELQPYATVDNPLKDEDYILDKSNKAVFGIKEIASYYDGQVSVETNYEPLTTQPNDWNVFFGNYYTRTIPESFDTYEPKKIGSGRRITFDDYVTIDSLDITQGEGELLVELTAGVDWYLFSPETVTTFTFNEDYRNWPVKIADVEYVVNSDSIVEVLTANLPAEYDITSDARKALYGYQSDVLELNYDYWVSDPVTRSKTIEFTSSHGANEYVSVAHKTVGETTYEPVKAEEDITYSLVSSVPADWSNNYSYYYKRSWDATAETYTYSSYAATNEIDMNNLVAIKSQPTDWAYNYSQYYYKFYNGVTYEARSYSGDSKPVYTLLKGQPEDWKTNYGSYYQMAYEVTYKENKKTKKVIKYTVTSAKKVSGYKSHKQVPVAVPTKKKKKNEKNYHKWPDWKPNKYYKQDSVTNPPSFNGANCWLATNVIVRPSFESGNCFEQNKSAKAPKFVNIDANGNAVYFRLVEDHYANLVRNGVDTLLNQGVGDAYDITVEDYEFNIGDIVGGEDEITGLNLPQRITNKIVKITRGVVYVDYEIGG